jgi:hypothetical protein
MNDVGTHSTVYLPVMGWCFRIWHSLSYLDFAEFSVLCVYRAAHSYCLLIR